MDTKQFSNEDAAERLTNIAGWVCKTCRTFCGDGPSGERAARYCCEKDHACGVEGCQKRAEKPYIDCEDCREKKQLEKWLALPEVEWDGVTPLVVDDDDKYLFSEDDLREYIEDGHDIENVRLVVCEEEEPPYFDMSEFLVDFLPPDTDVYDKKINKTVNDWIAKNTGKVWMPGKTRPSAASLRKALEIVTG